MSQEIISEIEKETGFVAIKREDLPATLDRDDYLSYVTSNIDKFIHVNYSDRIKFLNENKYAITFKNLIDSSLTATQKD